jgi:hypothetical protein
MFERVSVRPFIILIVLCVFIFAAAHERIIIPQSELIASINEWRRETAGVYNAWAAYAAELRDESHHQSKIMLESFDRQTQALREKTKETTTGAQEKLAQLASEWHTQRILLDEQLKKIKSPALKLRVRSEDMWPNTCKS